MSRIQRSECLQRLPCRHFFLSCPWYYLPVHEWERSDANGAVQNGNIVRYVMQMLARARNENAKKSGFCMISDLQPHICGLTSWKTFPMLLKKGVIGLISCVLQGRFWMQGNHFKDPKLWIQRHDIELKQWIADIWAVWRASQWRPSSLRRVFTWEESYDTRASETIHVNNGCYVCSQCSQTQWHASSGISDRSPFQHRSSSLINTGIQFVWKL